MTYIRRSVEFVMSVKCNSYLKDISERINEMGQFRYDDDDIYEWVDYYANDSDVFRFIIRPETYKDRLNVVDGKIQFRVYAELNHGRDSKLPHRLVGSLKNDIILLDMNEIHTLMVMSHDQYILIQNIINMYFGTANIRYEYLLK